MGRSGPCIRNLNINLKILKSIAQFSFFKFRLIRVPDTF